MELNLSPFLLVATIADEDATRAFRNYRRRQGGQQ
jgi:hypothetical protein